MTKSHLTAIVVVGVALFIAACGREKPNGRVTASYEEKTGRLRQIVYDSNKDGRPDMWATMDGTRVRQLDIDKDGDGKVDRWEVYAEGRLVKVGASAAHTATPDTWYYQDATGQLARVEKMAPNGGVRRTEFYERGAVARAEEDADGDGHADKWETYQSGHLVSVAFDPDRTGAPTRRLLYAADGSTRLETIAPAGATPEAR